MIQASGAVGTWITVAGVQAEFTSSAQEAVGAEALEPRVGVDTGTLVQTGQTLQRGRGQWWRVLTKKKIGAEALEPRVGVDTGALVQTGQTLQRGRGQ